MEDQFIKACMNGDIIEVKKLHSLGANMYIDNDNAFRWSCYYGHKEIAEWLYGLGETNSFISVNIHAYNDEAFRRSCYSAHREIAEWLYSLGVNIHAENNDAFRSSCINGQKEIVQWLLQVGKFDDELINELSEYYNEQLIKQIFDKGYKPLNDKMKKYYKEYYERKQEIRQNTEKYIIPELVDLVYDYE